MDGVMAAPGVDEIDGDYVCIGLEDEGLLLHDVKRENGEIWWCTATLRVAGLIAQKRRVSGHYAVSFLDLVEFFDGMAADWRGWKGTRAYESLEHDLHIEATHNGRVRLAVSLWQSSRADGWRASAVITLDPGEQLSRTAEGLRRLLTP